MKPLDQELDDLRYVTAAAIRVAAGSQFADALSLVALAQGVLCVPRMEGNATRLFEDALELATDRVKAAALIVDLASFAATFVEKLAVATGRDPESLLQEVARWHALRQVGGTGPCESEV